MARPFFPDVVVNGRKLSPAEIAAEAQNHPAPKGKPGLAWRKAARALAIRHLLLEEASSRGIRPEPKTLSPGRRETIEEAKIRTLLENVVAPGPVREEQLRAAYDKDPGAHRAPSLFQPAHILFAAAPDDAPARNEARSRAEAALSILRDSPDRFGEIARAESDCPSRSNDGQLGQLASGSTVPEFEQAMREAEIGAVHPAPVPTRYGIHVLRLDARAEGAVLPFESVRPRLAIACEKANWARAAHAFVTSLLDRAEIEGLDLQFTD